MGRLKIRQGGSWYYAGYGTQGDSGYSGYSGYSGSGISGYSGYSGVSGAETSAINFVIDGAGGTIATGIKGDVVVPFACNITEAWLLADQSGSISVDIWIDSYANYPPTVADQHDTYTISGATKSQETGLSIAVSADEVIRFYVNSATTIQRCLVFLKLVRT